MQYWPTWSNRYSVILYWLSEVKVGSDSTSTSHALILPISLCLDQTSPTPTNITIQTQGLGSATNRAKSVIRWDSGVVGNEQIARAQASIDCSCKASLVLWFAKRGHIDLPLHSLTADGDASVQEKNPSQGPCVLCPLSGPFSARSVPCHLNDVSRLQNKYSLRIG